MLVLIKRADPIRAFSMMGRNSQRVPVLMRKMDEKSWTGCTHKAARRLKILASAENQESRRPRYSFGDITRSCRHFFEGFPDGAKVIT
jgi:hypothetical protein